MGVPFLAPGQKAEARRNGGLSWIVYKSRASRPRQPEVEDARLAKMMREPTPFDVKRMAYGGFKVIVDL
jgi:uncharacterized protein YbaA (DUF1428 family)